MLIEPCQYKSGSGKELFPTPVEEGCRRSADAHDRVRLLINAAGMEVIDERSF
jgi:hypothetical protein